MRGNESCWAQWKVQVAVACMVWYAASAVCNTTARKVLTRAPLPVVLTLLQFGTATALGVAVIFALKLVEYRRPGPESLNTLGWLSTVYTIGFLFVNTGYVMVNVSLAETLRAAEPLTTTLLAVLFLKSESVSKMQMVAMIPIAVGGALSSAGDSSFSLNGLLSVSISNLAFSLRSMLTKRLKELYDGDSINVFFHVSLLGTIGLLVIFTVTTLYEQLAAAETQSAQEQLDELLNLDMLRLVVVNCLTYVIYNQTSFFVLSRVRMVTHGVANAFRRVVTIVFSVWYIGNSVNAVNALGISLALFGVLLYTKTKAEIAPVYSKVQSTEESDVEMIRGAK